MTCMHWCILSKLSPRLALVAELSGAAAAAHHGWCPPCRLSWQALPRLPRTTWESGARCRVRAISTTSLQLYRGQPQPSHTEVQKKGSQMQGLPGELWYSSCFEGRNPPACVHSIAAACLAQGSMASANGSTDIRIDFFLTCRSIDRPLKTALQALNVVDAVMAYCYESAYILERR